ncbi:high affinity immunoglobulin gamma Fc receptor I-like [Anabas testudineus]|uniref:high affinity immunoglobulin gamma Fc receptor I-like n=1 Tax=Anabas testudineus TaxID=64144 RepID=UPI00143D70A3|nr:high affinity immunoglobulin gamma Fc receptor I-like [Anabas testudineus]
MEVTGFCIRLLLNVCLLLSVQGQSITYALEAVRSSLHINPNRLQFFEYESLSLSCVGSHGPTEWRVMKKNPSNSPQWETSTGLIDIKAAFVLHSGEYFCENEEGERSNTVNIIVTAGDVILESPALPVTEGENVTLTCRKLRTSSKLPADFFKNGNLINTGYTGEVTIHNVSMSDEGFYKCSISGFQAESPESWLAVTADDVILESPAQPVMIGQIGTLHCKKRGTSSKLPADFYRNGNFINTGYTGEVTIHNISMSDEGFYKCSMLGFQGESPERWLDVTGSQDGKLAEYTKDLEEHTTAKLSFINSCVDSVTVVKRLRVYSNRKPWMTNEFQVLLKTSISSLNIYRPVALTPVIMKVQRVRVGPHLSTALRLNTGSPQGCVLSPLLYTLYTYECVSTHPDNIVNKFADDTVVRIISGGDETKYRDEIQWLVGWCADNNLVLNTTKTKEVIMDFRRKKSDLQSILINGDCVKRVPSFKYLGGT